MPKSTVLCGTRSQPGAVTVADYEKWCLESDGGWSKKPGFIRRRLRERYVTPVKGVKPSARHGFLTMAVSCLLIETLESFYRGWRTSKDKSKEAFRLFFRRNPVFGLLDVADVDDFYEGVRCALLHQGETSNGWTIVRNGSLLSGKRLNATLFHSTVSDVLDLYCKELRDPPANSRVRARFDGKMRAVIDNCM